MGRTLCAARPNAPPPPPPSSTGCTLSFSLCLCLLTGMARTRAARSGSKSRAASRARRRRTLTASSHERLLHAFKNMHLEDHGGGGGVWVLSNVKCSGCLTPPHCITYRQPPRPPSRLDCRLPGLAHACARLGSALRLRQAASQEKSKEKSYQERRRVQKSER